MTIDETKKKLYEQLGALIPVGGGNAISLHDVSMFLGMNKRNVKDLIHDAVVEEGMCIAGDDNGYYVPEDSVEFRCHCQLLKSRADATKERYEAMIKHSGEYGGND